jgi:hypothetical protein
MSRRGSCHLIFSESAQPNDSGPGPQLTGLMQRDLPTVMAVGRKNVIGGRRRGSRRCRLGGGEAAVNSPDEATADKDVGRKI